MGERGAKPEQGELFLPAGFRFHPRDDEVITSYLLPKFLNPSFSPRAMGEVNLNQCEPRDLPSKAKMGEKEWYFFCHKDMKYPTGMRTNRATKEGYWKATGRDREIFEPASAGGGGRELVGMKKTLVFYTGRAPRGSKTNWVMHEFRLEGKSRHNADLHLRSKDEWVVCKVFNKDNGEDNKKKAAAVEYSAGTPNVSSISAVDATGDEDDDPFINPTLHPMYFNSTSSLPDLTTIDDPWLAPPYSAADYSTASTAAAAATSTTSSFLVDLPYYTFSDSTVVPTSSSSSYNSPWNMLHAGHPVGSYNLHDQATMVKALGGVSSPSFAGGLTLPSSTVPGISQQNYSLGHNGSFGTNYLTSSASASATAITGTGQAAAKNNLGA